jgi:hypothetical protein
MSLTLIRTLGGARHTALAPGATSASHSEPDRSGSGFSTIDGRTSPVLKAAPPARSPFRRAVRNGKEVRAAPLVEHKKLPRAVVTRCTPSKGDCLGWPRPGPELEENERTIGRFWAGTESANVRAIVKAPGYSRRRSLAASHLGGEREKRCAPFRRSCLPEDPFGRDMPGDRSGRRP